MGDAFSVPFILSCLLVIVVGVIVVSVEFSSLSRVSEGQDFN